VGRRTGNRTKKYADRSRWSLRGEKVRLSDEDLRALHQLKGAK
jgi:hypothetical protein